MHFPVHHLNVLEDRIRAAAIHISQVIQRPHTFPMATVIVDHAYIAFFSHVFHKGKIALLVFAHPMNKLQDSFVRCLIRNHCQNGNIKSIRL